MLCGDDIILVKYVVWWWYHFSAIARLIPWLYDQSLILLLRTCASYNTRQIWKSHYTLCVVYTIPGTYNFIKKFCKLSISMDEEIHVYITLQMIYRVLSRTCVATKYAIYFSCFFSNFFSYSDVHVTMTRNRSPPLWLSSCVIYM